MWDEPYQQKTGMGGQSRSSRYRWLWLWCGILTVAVVTMAAVLTLSSTNKDGSSTHIPENDTTPATVAHFKSDGPPLSYIQLTLSHDDGHSWQTDVVGAFEPYSLILQNDSIHCKRDGVYFFYAHVTFFKIQTDAEHQNMQKKTVTLYGNGNGVDKSEKKLFEGVYSNEGEGSVSMAKMVRLEDGDSVRLDITNKYRAEAGNTYWGAYQI